MFAVKICGAILVMLSSAMLGINKAKSNKERIKYLEDMKNCTVILENEIGYTQTILSEIILKLSKSSHSLLQEVFFNTYNLMKEETGLTFTEIWKNSLEARKKDFFAEDMELLGSFSGCFNNSDIDGQLKLIRLYSERISFVINKIKLNMIK